MDKKLYLDQLDELLESKNSRPYVFRTRLERTIIRLISQYPGNENVLNICKSVKEKIGYLSDKSNQNSDGTLNTYSYFINDLKQLRSTLQQINT